LNCPVTVKDIKRAVDIWGPDLGSVKGKTTPDKAFITLVPISVRDLIALLKVFDTFFLLRRAWSSPEIS